MLRTIVLASLIGLSPADLSEPDRILIEQGARCGVDPWTGFELLRVEELAGVDKPRGMLIAKACFESRGNPRAIGDAGKAVGLLQLWSWAEVTTDRTHPIGSAYAFVGAILDSMRRTKRHCPRARDVFKLSWIRVNRGPVWRRPDRRGEPRCSGTSPAGLKLLRRWTR